MGRTTVLAIAVAALTMGVGLSNASSLLSMFAPTPTAVPTKTAAQLLEAVAPSVVRIRTGDSEGTGFVVFDQGLVLTAYHVVGSSAARPTVVSVDGQSYESVVLGADEEKDLALLTVPRLKAPPLPLALTVSVGDTVIAVGYAAGLPGGASVTRGIVSALRPDPETGVGLVQTDAPINPGNSGGPLANDAGEVVGMNVSRWRGSRAQYENMGFAVSSDEIKAASTPLSSGIVRGLPTATPRPVTSTQAPVPQGRPSVGKTLIVAKGCASCHLVPGVPQAKGTTAPSLAGFAKRPLIAGALPNNADNLAKWLRSPPAVKPGTPMPMLNLSASEIRDLSEFLRMLY